MGTTPENNIKTHDKLHMQNDLILTGFSKEDVTVTENDLILTALTFQDVKEMKLDTDAIDKDFHDGQ